MPTYVGDYMEATILINSSNKGGWSEKYLLQETEYAPAKTKLATIINYRTAILAAGFSCVHATVSKKGRIGDSAVPTGYSADPALLVAEVAVEGCNNPGVGLLYRFDTGTGKFSNRLIRGVRDSWILGNANQVAVNYISSFGSIGARPAFGTSMVNALTYYLKTVAANTVFIIDRWTLGLDPVPAAEQRYEAVPWNRIQFRKVAQRDTGPGYSSKRARRRHTV